MTYSLRGIGISVGLLALLIFFRYRNLTPKFIFPVSRLSPVKYRFQTISMYMIMIAVLLLPLHIGFVADKQVSIQTSTPVQILLDVSLSMAATDMPPSRFSVAKTYLADAVRHLTGYDVSLIAFSGIPFVSLPFSHDTQAILQSLTTMSLAEFPAAPEFLGTALGDALLLGAANIQRLSSAYPGIVLLITDGDSNKGYDPADVISLLQKQNISVRVLAIGQADYLIGYDQFQQAVVTSINIPLLQDIAVQTSGTFLNVVDTGDLEHFFTSFLTTVKAREISQISLRYRYLDKYLLGLLLLGLVSLLLLRFDFWKKTHTI